MAIESPLYHENVPRDFEKDVTDDFEKAINAYKMLVEKGLKIAKRS